MLDYRRQTGRRRLREIARNAIDARIGILRSIREEPLTPGAPEFFHVYALASNTRAFTSQTNFSNSGGAAADRLTAVGKAIGEAVERYCGAIFDYAELPLTSRAAAQFTCVDPTDFALYSNEQYTQRDFKYAPFHDDTSVRWVRGVDALSGAGVYLPAGMVFVPYYYYEGDEGRDTPIAQPISTGLACHASRERATVSAICEVIERDAFMITWQAGLSMPHIVVESLSDANYDLVRRFETHGLSVTLLNLTMDVGVPTVLTVVQSRDPGEPAMVVAAATDPDPETAVRKSLEEVAHTRRYADMVKRFTPRERLQGFTGADVGVDRQQDHLLYWSLHEHTPQADFLLASDERVEFEDIDNLMPETEGSMGALTTLLCERVAATNHRVYLVDLTTPDVAALGLHVVRAVIPGFHPMFMGHDVRALHSRRLRQVPVRMGFDARTGNGEINAMPHPYP